MPQRHLGLGKPSHLTTATLDVRLRNMPKQSAQLDDVFRALADPTRRAVIERLGRGPATVSELAEPFPMALPSFVQHLGVLERCALVRSEKRGRVRTYELATDELEEAEHWLRYQRTTWERRLDQLDAFLTRPEPQPRPQLHPEAQKEDTP
jgi:DNA-binding transcriptional ArsR family regulator